jgi:Protein of unknown function (DUF2783)
MMLKTNLNLANADAIYAALIAAHEGLPEEESHAMNARLILLLMNHIGDEAVLRDALARARNPKS